MDRPAETQGDRPQALNKPAVQMPPRPPNTPHTCQGVHRQPLLLVLSSGLLFPSLLLTDSCSTFTSLARAPRSRIPGPSRLPGHPTSEGCLPAFRAQGSEVGGKVTDCSLTPNPNCSSPRARLNSCSCFPFPPEPALHLAHNRCSTRMNECMNERAGKEGGRERQKSQGARSAQQDTL